MKYMISMRGLANANQGHTSHFPQHLWSSYEDLIHCRSGDSRAHCSRSGHIDLPPPIDVDYWSVEWLSYFEHVVQFFFQTRVFFTSIHSLQPHPTTYQSNIGVRLGKQPN